MFTLYENIKSLCDQRGVKPGKMCVEAKISKGLITDLKMGRKKTVQAETAKKIADYFGVSVDYLLNGPDAVLYSAAKDAVVNREFSELPISTRETMLQGIKKSPVQPDGGEEEFMQLFRQLSPEVQERELAYLRQLAAHEAAQDK